MKRIMVFLVWFTLTVSVFAQSVKDDPSHFISDVESFIGGCGLKYSENDFRFLNPKVQTIIDSGIVNLPPEKFVVCISPQSDGTKQSECLEGSQLFGINQKMQDLRFAFLKAYLESLGYTVVKGEYRFSVQKGPEYRGAWVKFVQKETEVQTSTVEPKNASLFVEEKINGLRFPVTYFKIPEADTTRWIDCRAYLISNMGLVESDSIYYEVSHKDAGMIDQQGRFRSAGIPGDYTISAKYKQYSDRCEIVVVGSKYQPESPKAGSIAERVDVLVYVNQNSAAGAGVMMQFNSGLLVGVANSVKHWNGKSENLLNPFLGYGFYALPNFRIALLAGPVWHSELDDNQFDAIGPIGGLHADFQVGRVGIFGQLLVAKLFEHQHGKTSPSRLYQDPSDPNTIGVKNDVIREDLKYWRDPELFGRVGLSIQL